MNILIAGDFCQRYRVDGIIKEKRFEELFDEVKPIIESADYSIVNFEFPIVLNKDAAKPIPKCGPNLQGSIEAVDAVKYAGFNCCTLANNHILDQGEQCCLDTKNELERAGIDTVGAGKNLSEAANILYKVINGETIAIINCCEHEFTIATDTSAGANPLNPIQQYYTIQEAKEKADFVLVIVHGGHEHFQLPSPRMQETYRFFIEAGADAVVNHHQHCYSGYEVYKNKPIFYGLGNFCFDNPQKRNCIWNEGYVVMIEFSKNEIEYEIIPYKQNDVYVGVKPIENGVFFKHMEYLNSIIASNDKLQLAVHEFYQSNTKEIIARYQPYSNRVFNKLFRMGIMPSFVSKKRFLTIWNWIGCEAHQDNQIYSFQDYLLKCFK